MNLVSKKKWPAYRCAVCGKPLITNHPTGSDTCCSPTCVKQYHKRDKRPKGISVFAPLTDDGAYILGFVASSGKQVNHTIEIRQRTGHGNMLSDIARLIFGTDEAVRDMGNDMLLLTTHDEQFVNHVSGFLGTDTDDKHWGYELPDTIPEDKKWSFICGYFDGDAGAFQYHYKCPEISISSDSHTMLMQLSEYWEVDSEEGNRISAFGYKALDICGRMYEKVSLRHSEKYECFTDILNWEPLPIGPWLNDNYFKCKKLDKDAIIPVKKRVTDSGYDIYAITLDYDEETGLYVADMRLAIEPLPGYYFDMVGRSSLPSSGFCFVGGVGIIDRSYVGSLKMKLLRISQKAKLPSLPFRCGQLIPRKIIHADFIEVDALSDSDRGSRGFGSSG